MNELHKKEMAEANAKVRGLLRLIMGIAIGIASAKTHSWQNLIEYTLAILAIEAFLGYVFGTIKFYKVYRDMYNEWSSAFIKAYGTANKFVWKQIFLSLFFIGIVASVTKLIANIFIK